MYVPEQIASIYILFGKTALREDWVWFADGLRNRLWSFWRGDIGSVVDHVELDGDEMLMLWGGAWKEEGSVGMITRWWIEWRYDELNPPFYFSFINLWDI